MCVCTYCPHNLNIVFKDMVKVRVGLRYVAVTDKVNGINVIYNIDLQMTKVCVGVCVYSQEDICR